MTTAWNTSANSVALRRAYAGTEVIAGTPVAPTYKLYGNMMLSRSRPLAQRQDFGGTLFRDYNPLFGPWEIDGTYEQPLSYEDLAILTRYGLAGGGAGVSDSESTPGYAYVRTPNDSALDIDSATIEGGTPNMPWTAAGVIFPEFTIRGDIDDAQAAWQWSSPIRAISRDFEAVTDVTATGGSTTTVVKTAAAWSVNGFAGAWYTALTGTAGNIGLSREILSNTADTLTLSQAFPATVAAADTGEISGVFTAGITDRVTEIIDAPGTELYLDTVSAIGTTQILGRFISFEVTYNGGITSYKRFMENIDGFTARPDMSPKFVTGQLVLEYDRGDEYQTFVDGGETAIRILQEGDVIDSGAGTHSTAQIDIFRAIWDSPTESERNGNITITLPFVGFVDSSEGVPFEITAINELATLP